MAVCRLVILAFCTIGWAQNLLAQTDRYVVFFKDKNNSPYSAANPQAFLSERAIARRSKSNVSVVDQDLPVNPNYVSQVRATGAKAFFTSRWMNLLLVEATSSQISAIASLPVVSRTELVAPGKQLQGGRVGKSSATRAEATTDLQLSMLGIDHMHADGYRGNGIRIAVFDAGFPGVNTLPAFQPIFQQGRMIMTSDFVFNSGNVYQYNGHGTEVFSVIAGSGAGFTGGADAGAYMLFVTEDYFSEYRIEEYNWLFAAERADSAGVDIIQASLGYNSFDDYRMDYSLASLDGKSAVVTLAAGMARDRAIIVSVSAGNEGNKPWHYITPPADADGILATGALTSSLARASFSSFGPTIDGRIKPDVMALGSGTAVIRQDGSVASDNGTSFASPLVASLAAGLLQAYPELKPRQLVEIIRNTASMSSLPNNSMGNGIPSYTAVRNFMTIQELSEDIYLFPNPVVDHAYVGFSQLPTSAVGIQIFDVSGKSLLTASVLPDWENNPLEIPVSNLGPGLYFLRITTSTEVRVLRFAKL